jgi:A/G-specific adenine glycosylase
VALETDRVSQLPQRRKRKALQTRRCTMLLVIQGEAADARIVVCQRPGTGIWPGLLSLPESPLPADAGAAEHLSALSSAGVTLAASDAQAPGPASGAVRAARLAPVHHAFTHFKLQIDPIVVSVHDLLVSSPARWLALKEAADAPLPAPVKKLLLQRLADMHGPGA